MPWTAEMEEQAVEAFIADYGHPPPGYSAWFKKKKRRLPNEDAKEEWKKKFNHTSKPHINNPTLPPWKPPPPAPLLPSTPPPSPKQDQPPPLTSLITPPSQEPNPLSPPRPGTSTSQSENQPITSPLPTESTPIIRDQSPSHPHYQLPTTKEDNQSQPTPKIPSLMSITFTPHTICQIKSSLQNSNNTTRRYHHLPQSTATTQLVPLFHTITRLLHLLHQTISTLVNSYNYTQFP